MGCNSSKETEVKQTNEKNKNSTAATSSETATTYRQAKLFSKDDFVVGDFIQEGGQGKVYVGTEKSTGQKFALKFFGYTGRHPKLKEINEEIDLMANLHGIDGMVQMHGVFMDTAAGIIPGKMATAFALPVIIMELLEGGELFERIADRATFSENNIAKIFKGIILAMDSMHKRRYIHRDVKLENLMLVTTEDDSPVKVIDFGMMVKLGDGHHKYVGTAAVGSPGYIAPESITRYDYSSASDLWQAACTLYSLLSGLLPFHPQDYKQITQRSYYPMSGVGWDNISAGAKDLVAKMLRKRPEKRLSVKEILAHPWVVSEAPDEDLGADYFTRLKHLALRQRLKAFFNDSNIEEDNKERQANLKNVIPMLHMKNSDFDKKLKQLKHHMVDSFKKSASGEHDLTASKGVPPGEIGYDEFCSILDRAGLPEMKSHVVFNIFDTGNTGSVDMKDFLLTMVAFRPDTVSEVRDVIDKTIRDDSDINLLDNAANKPNPILESEQNISSMDDQCRLYFHVFDVNETGFIDLEELKLVVGSLLQEGKSISSDKIVDDEDENEIDKERRSSSGAVYKSAPGMCNIEELFKVIDIDKSGKINFEEFQKFYDAVLTFSTRRSVM